MTTNSRAAKPDAEEQPAEPETGPGGTVPEDEQELRQDIEQTREQLGETVEQLAAKTDVKAKARAKAAGLGRRLKGKVAQAQDMTADRGAGVRGQVADKTMMARQKAVAAKDQLQTQMAPVWEAAPEPVRRTAAKGVSTVRQRRVPLAVAAAALIASYLALRWWRKR